jgi:nucleoside-triphosphatase
LQSAASDGADVVVIDEIARMAMACQGFTDVVLRLFASEVAVVATVHTRPDVFTDALKNRPGVDLVEVEPSIREELDQRLLFMLTSP